MSRINIRKRGKVYEYFFEGAKVNNKRTRISKSGFKTQNEAYEYGLKAYFTCSFFNSLLYRNENRESICINLE